MNDEEKEIHPEQLRRLSTLNYDELLMAPASERGFTAPRYIMQVRQAQEAHRFGTWVMWATIVGALATVVTAVTPFLKHWLPWLQ